MRIGQQVAILRTPILPSGTLSQVTWNCCLEQGEERRKGGGQLLMLGLMSGQLKPGTFYCLVGNPGQQSSFQSVTHDVKFFHLCTLRPSPFILPLSNKESCFGTLDLGRSFPTDRISSLSLWRLCWSGRTFLVCSFSS